MSARASDAEAVAREARRLGLPEVWVQRALGGDDAVAAALLRWVAELDAEAAADAKWREGVERGDEPVVAMGPLAPWAQARSRLRREGAQRFHEAGACRLALAMVAPRPVEAPIPPPPAAQGRVAGRARRWAGRGVIPFLTDDELARLTALDAHGALAALSDASARIQAASGRARRALSLDGAQAAEDTAPVDLASPVEPER